MHYLCLPLEKDLKEMKTNKLLFSLFVPFSFLVISIQKEGWRRPGDQATDLVETDRQTE